MYSDYVLSVSINPLCGCSNIMRHSGNNHTNTQHVVQCTQRHICRENTQTSPQLCAAAAALCGVTTTTTTHDDTIPIVKWCRVCINKTPHQTHRYHQSEEVVLRHRTRPSLAHQTPKYQPSGECVCDTYSHRKHQKIPGRVICC